MKAKPVDVRTGQVTTEGTACITRCAARGQPSWWSRLAAAMEIT